MDSRCDICKYFDPSGATDGMGLCLKRAPVADTRQIAGTMTNHTGGLAVFPAVQVDWWCGSFVKETPR